MTEAREFNSFEQFTQFLSAYEHILIYGFGLNGKRLAKGLRDYADIRVSAFVVTDMSVQDKDAVNESEIPVFDVLSAVNKLENHMILISNGAYKDKIEIVKYMQRNRIGQYMEVPEIVWHVMRCRELNHAALEFYENAARASADIDGWEGGKLRIGHLASNYPERRTIIGKLNALPQGNEKAEYFAIPREIDEQACDGEAFYQPIAGKPDVDIIHTFNSVCVTDIKWCANFETMIPRVIKNFGGNPGAKMALFDSLAEKIEKDNCIGIFPLCKNAYQIAEEYLEERVGTIRTSNIKKKMAVLYPPQDVLLSDSEQSEKFARMGRHIDFLLIANDFFFKGGREIIKALKAFEGKYDFRLKIIGLPLHPGYFVPVTDEEIRRYEQIIEETSWIDDLGHLPNQKVLEECKMADVGLLPSFADTFGYSVLEMQAAGCPVITSNTRAFPEINSEQCGWMCHIPTDKLNFARKKDLGMETLSDILTEELKRCFESVFSHPESIAGKGRASLERIKKEHSPKCYAQNLWKIYHGAYFKKDES